MKLTDQTTQRKLQEIPQTQGEAPSIGEWKFLKAVVYGVTAVIGLAMIGLVLQYMTATQAAFQSLNNQVVEQNAKIEMLVQLLMTKK